MGMQLRELRHQHGRSLASVARACGMSLGLLSQIERGLSSMSVQTLHRLAKELGVTTESLLRNANAAPGEADGHVARAGTHRRLAMHARGVDKEDVTPPAAQDLELCRAVIAAGGASGDTLFTNDCGEHIGLVLSGRLELWLGTRALSLGPGDSFCYDGRSARRWRNPGETPAEVIWAIARPGGSPSEPFAPP